MDPYNDYEHHSRSVGIFPFSMHSMQCVVMTAECCTSKDNTNACPSCVWWRDASACAIQTFQAWEFMAQQSQKPLPKWNLTYLLGINNIYIYIYMYIYGPLPFKQITGIFTFWGHNIMSRRLPLHPLLANSPDVETLPRLPWHIAWS